MRIRFSLCLIGVAAFTACDLQDPSVDIDEEPADAQIQSTCTIGTSTIANCSFQSGVTTTVTPDGATITSPSPYGNSACRRWPVNGASRTKKHDEVTARLAVNVPRCECEDVLVSLEYEDFPCTVIQNDSVCIVDGVCEGAGPATTCCPVEGVGCQPTQACVGATVSPNGEVAVCSTTREIARATAPGTWDSAQGKCLASVTITRWDSLTRDRFEGDTPQLRAAARRRNGGNWLAVQLQSVSYQ
jgi:hypothetical protein